MSFIEQAGAEEEQKRRKVIPVTMDRRTKASDWDAWVGVIEIEPVPQSVN